MTDSPAPDLSIRSNTHKFKCRVAVLLEHKGSVLFQRLLDRDYWFLPGGHVKFGESSVDTLTREMREELGIDVKPVKLLSVCENMFIRKEILNHEVIFFWRAEASETDLEKLAQPVDQEGISEMRWIPISEFEAHPILPPETKSLVQLTDKAALVHHVRREL